MHAVGHSFNGVDVYGTVSLWLAFAQQQKAMYAVCQRCCACHIESMTDTATAI